MTFDLSQHVEENFDGTKICGGGAVDELGDDRLTLGDLPFSVTITVSFSASLSSVFRFLAPGDRPRGLPD